MSGPARERIPCEDGVGMTTIGKVAAVIIGLCLMLACAVAGGAPAVASDDPSSVANSTIPAALLSLFQQASAESSCGVPWTLLAAVAHTESDFDPTVTSSAGAEGLFQFEPATFAAHDRPTATGGAVPPSPFDPTDATYAAARYMCSLGIVADPTSALVAYNCGNPDPACQAASAGYAAQVLATAASYTASGSTETGTSSEMPTAVQAAAVSYAESQIGTPYVWGGTSPKTGFDCSGLVVWAYGLAGVVVPRVANDQWHDEPHVAMGQLVPGDLIFFGTGDYADHVGIFVGGSAIVDAPYTGADVRIDTIPMSVGAAWGSQVVLGAADPVSQSAATR
jgi:cell wall-associated NlpC family hydrolase